MSEELELVEEEPLEPPPPPDETAVVNDAEVEREIRSLSRRSFLLGGVAIAAGIGGWRWLVTRRSDAGVPWPLRRVIETNEQLGRDFQRNHRLAPTFARSRAEMPRVNGGHGVTAGFDPGGWKLGVQGLAGPGQTTVDSAGPVVQFGIEQIKALPRVEMTTELKCIEGWSTVVNWAGARFADFIAAYPPATRSGEALDMRRRPDDLPGYVAITTPDGAYFVGLDIESVLHPQTLLCYEMNGAALALEHGAPLRLAMPLKYGIKSIKRIGHIHYTDIRPRDFWAERGYDWFAGH